ncbi:MAG TPA: c-type cytochrome [Marinobacter sp.]|uniref:C-type cytochrome n=2 Tax=root TaxID=1 RepID=A0A831R2K9_9GAMM|nr:cytochrome c [Marinobacter antarcticus]HDZ38281.1 c-type cytochrome [Marinobacter sp.]HEA52923.1 c-type cytochrome [Marinobacter antarcticus]
MNEHDHRAQNREAPEPEEGTRAAPKFVFAWIAILIVWGVGYYAWQIGKPMLGGDSRTPVAAEHPQTNPAKDVTAEQADGVETNDGTDTADSVEAADSTETSAASEPDSSIAAATPDGAALFGAHCSACHQASGQGIPGAFPPLAGSKWLQGDPAIPVAIVHDGLQGNIEVAGNTFQGAMPKFGGQLSDAELAAVLSYTRSQWGNDASDISPKVVAEHKERFGDRAVWSADELVEVFGKP